MPVIFHRVKPDENEMGGRFVGLEQQTDWSPRRSGIAFLAGTFVQRCWALARMFRRGSSTSDRLWFIFDAFIHLWWMSLWLIFTTLYPSSPALCRWSRFCRWITGT